MSFDHRQCVARNGLAHAENRIVQRRVNVAEEHTAPQRVVGLTQPAPDHERLLGAGNAAADERQESARVDRSAAQQCDGRAFDHEITRLDARRYRFEFQERQGSVSLLFLRHAVQTMRK